MRIKHLKPDDYNFPKIKQSWFGDFKIMNITINMFDVYNRI